MRQTMAYQKFHKLLLLFIVAGSILFSFVQTVYALKQEKDSSWVACCEDSILQTIHNPTNCDSILVRFESDSTLIVDARTTVIRLKHPKISRWYAEVDRSSIRGYRLSLGTTHYLALSSVIDKATGLMVNFTSWLLVDPLLSNAITLVSLSNKPKFFMIDSTKHELKFVRFDFSAEFISKKDYSSIMYNVEHCEWSTGSHKLKVVMAKSCRCP
jgi:hypothetical protein